MNPKSSLFQSDFYLTDGGLETTLIFQQKIELNHFAAFELLNFELGKRALSEYYRPYLDLAEKHNLNFILETPTWRANKDWAFLLGYSSDELHSINKKAVAFTKSLVSNRMNDNNKIIISGNIGPRGDGYIAKDCMNAMESMKYHEEQVQTFAMSDVDIITAMTINYTSEATGITMAAKKYNVPVVISFTVETDGKLPNGENLSQAIIENDKLTDNYVSHYMINCAHPEHFEHILRNGDQWKYRIKGIRANASTKSHAELDECEILDQGDKHQLAAGYSKLKQQLPELRIIGGCCGTDHTHIECVLEAMMPKVK